jgi:hypothetical protein
VDQLDQDLAVIWHLKSCAALFGNLELVTSATNSTNHESLFSAGYIAKTRSGQVISACASTARLDLETIHHIRTVVICSKAAVLAPFGSKFYHADRDV